MSSSVESWERQPLDTVEEWESQRDRLRHTANNAILHLHPPRVPAAALRFTYTWGLGGISATLATIMALTGVLLMFRYEPSIERAYASIQVLESKVMFGSLVRAIHHWAANLLVITAFLHLVRILLTGGFKKGRFANWMVGIGLLLLVLMFNFTGYLLPWDQLAYWAVTVVTSMIAYIPVVGMAISRWVLGGSEVGQGALSNFYALHVAVLPALMITALGYHFWKIRKDGGISQPELKPGEREVRVSTIPHLVRVELAAMIVVVVAVLLFSMIAPAPLEELANPLRPPNPAKTTWYFAGVQELLLHMHALAAMILVAIVLMGMALLPKWDRREADIGIYFRSERGRKAVMIAALLSLYLVPALVVADEYLVDWLTLLPGMPILVSTGLLPLLLTLAGLVCVYVGLRVALKLNHSESVLGLMSFVLVSLLVLMVVGVFFRGPNMALVLPF